MTVGTYCGVDAHDRCPGKGCTCKCHASALGSLPCPECGRGCGSKAGLMAHMRAMHPDTVPASNGDTTPTPAADGIVWDDPPVKGRRTSTLVRVAPQVPQLRRHPGRWARLVDLKAKSSASSALPKLRKEFPDIEFRAARFGEVGSAVWGRYVEDAA